MLETAVIIANNGAALYWHAPANRTLVSLPDSRTLWEVLWRHRHELAGVAHTHPGGGAPLPSRTDLTTFDACELGLGLRLRWWIATRDQLRCFTWRGPDTLDYGPIPLATSAPCWLAELRDRSGLYERGDEADNTSPTPCRIGPALAFNS